MKKIYYISIIFTILVFNACKESFLDQEVPLVSNEELIYTDGTQTEMALLGLYTSLKGTNSDFMGGKTYIVFDNRGDDIKNIDPNLVTLYDTYRMNVGLSYSENANAWYYAYLAINRANVFIESVAQYNTESVTGKELADQFVSEAKFIRALCYYYLINLYSEPYIVNNSAKAFPLRLTAIKESGHSDCPSSTVGAIYNAILDDLSNENINALPSAVNTYDAVTRASKGAANMLKMRVLMAMGRWGDAITAGAAITGYSLTDDVRAQFATPYFTPETIFAIPHSTNNLPNTQRSPYEYYYSGSICIIDKDNGVMSLPNYSLADDKRVIAFDDNGKLTKWNGNDKLQWLPIFRYAETKLNLAECYAKNSQEELAKTALNDVRSRSVNPATDPLNVSTLSGTALLNAITNEKRLEFLGEGMRGIEIMRKGENFIKGADINVAPGNTGYTWPVPEDERATNSLWNQLAE
jgi:hypothetical protein